MKNMAHNRTKDPSSTQARGSIPPEQLALRVGLQHLNLLHTFFCLLQLSSDGYLFSYSRMVGMSITQTISGLSV